MYFFLWLYLNCFLKAVMYDQLIKIEKEVLLFIYFFMNTGDGKSLSGHSSLF